MVDAQGRISLEARSGSGIATVDKATAQPAGTLPILRTDVDDVDRFHGDVPIARGPWLGVSGSPR